MYVCDGAGTTETILSAWRVLEDQVLTGHARAIGVSNFDAEELEWLHAHPTTRIRPMVLQNKWDPYHQGSQLHARYNGSPYRSIRAHCMGT